MNLLPAFATTSSNSNIADLLSKPLSCHRFDTLIGDIHSPTPLSASAHIAATVDSATVAPASAVVASTTTTSDLVPTLQPNLGPAPTLPIALDTGASYSLTPFQSDFIPVPFGLIQSFALVVSKATSKAYSPYSTPVDPYTLITGRTLLFRLISRLRLSLIWLPIRSILSNSPLPLKYLSSESLEQPL